MAKIYYFANLLNVRKEYCEKQGLVIKIILRNSREVKLFIFICELEGIVSLHVARSCATINSARNLWFRKFVR